MSRSPLNLRRDRFPSLHLVGHKNVATLLRKGITEIELEDSREGPTCGILPLGIPMRCTHIFIRITGSSRSSGDGNNKRVEVGPTGAGDGPWRPCK